jgi:hypothetical protein
MSLTAKASAFTQLAEAIRMGVYPPKEGLPSRRPLDIESKEISAKTAFGKLAREVVKPTGLAVQILCQRYYRTQDNRRLSSPAA